MERTSTDQSQSQRMDGRANSNDCIDNVLMSSSNSEQVVAGDDAQSKQPLLAGQPQKAGNVEFGEGSKSHSDEYFKSPRNTDSDGKPRPNEVYGRVNFLGHSQPNYAPYTRISTNDKAEDVINIMEKDWNLDFGKLQLVLSVTGGATDLKLTPIQTAAIKNGIMSVATEAGGWITSGGTDTGIMKICGEAVAEYREINHNEKFVLIGIATWGQINNNSVLVHNDSRDWQCYYKDERQNQPGPDCNHTHFIFVTDGTDKDFGVEIKMRTKIEKQIVKKAKCQCVCLVVEGGIGTADTTSSTLEKNIPIVVLEGSGRFADVLAWTYHEYSRFDDLENKRDSFNTEYIAKKVKFKISQWCSPKRLDECYSHVLKCLEKKDLIFIQKLEPFNSESIYNTIMLAFVKGYFKDKPKEQLEKALKLNQLEIANQIFMTNLFDVDFLKELLQIAIANGQAVFIKLLTENGVRLCDLDSNSIKVLKERIAQKHKNLFKKEVEKYKGEEKKAYAAVLAFLTIKKEITSLIEVLQNINEPIASCLFICKICQNLRSTEVFQNKGHFCEIDSVQNEFENLAIDIIDKCFENSESNTYELLLQESSFNRTVLQQGIRADCRKFMATEAVQSLFSSIWNGQILYSESHDGSFDRFESKFRISPKTKCYISILFSLIFVLLFSLFLIIWYNVNKVSWFEYFLCVTIIAYTVEECRQCYSATFYRYFADFWNYVDVIGILTFYVGFLIRFALLIFGFNQSFVQVMMNVSRFAYLGSLISYYVKLMQACYFNSRLGPKIEMIKKMMYDLAFFFVILVIFLFGFGVTEYVLLSVSSTASANTANSTIWDVLNVVLAKPYFRLYGELFMDDLLTRNMVDNFNILVVGIYMIITHVLLLNMLIAMFGYTFSEVQKETDIYWKFYRFKFLSEYSNRPALPGPLMLFSHVYLLIKWMFIKWFQRDTSPNINEKLSKLMLLQKFEKEKFKDVIWKRHVKLTNSIEYKVTEVQLAITKATEEKLSEMKNTMNKLSNKLEKLLKDKPEIAQF